jgi:two-component system sensor histidine kinase PilS (NtrC family)
MPPAPPDTPSPQHRELYFFALFRVLEAGILGLVAFTPLGRTMAEIREPLILKMVASGYFIAAVYLLWRSLDPDVRLRRFAAIGLLLDLVVWGVALLSMVGGESGLANYMVNNNPSAPLILTPAASQGFAMTA